LHVFSHFGKLGGKQEGKYCGYQWGKGNEGWERVIKMVSMIKVDDTHE
jgi:hypothetical protein